MTNVGPPATGPRWSVVRFDRAALVPAAAAVVLLLVVASRYGFHRDELYFIESMRHPAWGYIDNPSATPAIGWLSRQIFGDSVFGLRVIPAVEVGAIVVVVAAITRELGGSARAQRLAAVVGATSSLLLAIGHLLTTPTLDVLVSFLVTLLLVHIVRNGHQRTWLLLGGTIGIGLENKYTLALFLLALLVGIVATRSWRGMFSWWTVAAAAVATAIWLPQLLWQIHHHWPQISFARNLAREEGTGNRISVLPFQILIIGPPMIGFLVVALRALFRDARFAAVRFFGVGYVVLLVLLLATGGKGYYAAGSFGAIIAVGAVAISDRGEAAEMAQPFLRRHRALSIAIVANLVIGGIITLPVLPARWVKGPIVAINPDVGETIGWPSFVDQLAAVADEVPAAERSSLVVFTGDYGEAGAVDRFGAAHGIGPAYSGHNSYADFGIPPGSAGPVLVVGYRDLGDGSLFVGCVSKGQIHTIDGLDNDADGEELWLCDRPARPWADLWATLRHED